MSRSDYSEDLDDWALIRWRGAVISAIRGKRGQTFLKELEAALVALPQKRLIAEKFCHNGEVCALGSVAVARKVASDKPQNQAMKEVEEEFDPWDYAGTAGKLGIAEALAQEIMFLNDENPYGENTPEKRYEAVLRWVREQIKKGEPA
jgi:hypothetical protein